ncbi:helix-turn-helix domain-containing protein [Saccharopolyspora spinosa]|uniref:Helix-turn-helix protein n=2 Tax=Saccharopolyspora spinosa TaxID=60894 RepID=A0A2N3Y727_SACSN|nr:helix-turn-helix transcriptional regulator [Saccharopolyspora spinosa]PKW18742.1 helix-turn-helix protein [Saccharopolyspora spinosa]
MGTERGKVHHTFAEKLDLLFGSVRREDGERHTVREVAKGCGMSKTHLYNLLSGDREPSHATVKALAEFFDVPLDYFADNERGRELTSQYALLAKFGEGKLRALARGAEQLSVESMNNVLAFIEFEASRQKKTADDHSPE